MANEIVTWDLMEDISPEKQELLTGGSDFELSGSNFANRGINLQGTTASGPAGSVGNSSALKNATVTAAQDYLGLGGSLPQNVAALGSPSFAQEGGFGGPGFGGPGFR
jgi:hypothetical protein